MTEAGFRTQVALAERIADIEGLESVPKDVVNRVFRERPVDPTTIERVARALGVEAYALYKTSDEDESFFAGSDSGPPPSTWIRRRRSTAVAAILTFIVTVGVIWWIRASTPVLPGKPAGEATVTRLSLGSQSLAVIPFAEDTDGSLATALRNELRRYFSVAGPTADALTRSHDAGEVAQRLRTDVVIDGDIKQVGRLSAVRVYLFKGGVRQQVWADSVPTVALQDASASIAVAATLAVRQAMGMPVQGSAALHFPLAPVQDDYLEGERNLDRESNELNIKRAQSRFEAALRQDANYARAHAGLCRTFLLEYWMDNEDRALKAASLACGQALQLDPDDRVVRAAHALFLRRTGRNEDAIGLYEQLSTLYPNDADVLEGLASSLLDAFRESGDREMLLRAKAAARQAAHVDPYVWKPLFSLGAMEWFDGDVEAAIAATEAALGRHENEFVLANLGSFYLCDGALEKARDAYARARDFNPQSYVGDEFLGQAYYFLGDFEKSAQLRQQAVDSVSSGNPEIHEMWGNLGDSYRQIGDPEKAVAAYTRAAEIAERDYLRGNMPVGDQAARAYYYTMLATLDPGTVPDEVLNTIGDTLDTIAASLVSASSLRRIAQVYLRRGEPGKAHDAFDRAIATCKGYALFPDLAEIADKTLTETGT